jgi:biopolymer transport protein ExbB
MSRSPLKFSKVMNEVMNMKKSVWMSIVGGMVVQACWAQQEAATNAAVAMQARLDRATRQLTELRETIAREKIPLAKAVSDGESTLGTLRKAYETVKHQSDTRALEAASLHSEIKQRETERNYLCSLFGEYARNVETRLHISELDLYKETFETVRTAQDRLADTPKEVFNDQLCLILQSLARLEELAGGLIFTGRASDTAGTVKEGTFLILGPVAYFASSDGTVSGVANQRIGSLIPVVEPFGDPAYQRMTAETLRKKDGTIPFDASLGNAKKIEETKETLKEHFLKGGPVMWPMFVLMCLTILVVIMKWLWLTFTRIPGDKRLAELLAAVATKEQNKALAIASKIYGPAGRMLRAGCERLGQPKELIEEAMFEKMLLARSQLNRLIPFVAVAAACAPLLGLLGTVTGIITTFKLMTIFGSGDVKVLSSGISEALITTEYGLYIAIPAVLCHSFLNRKAKGIADKMEQIAIRFMGEIGKV